MNTLDGIDWRFLDGVDWSEVAAFASIPVVASMIGYGTNVLAIQMTFLPLDVSVSLICRRAVSP